MKIYNRHAMLFIEDAKDLKVKGRYVKKVNETVYSCGFPASTIEEVKGRLTEMGGEFEEKPEMITVTGIAWPTKGDYGVLMFGRFQ
ncbi:MAG: hypothetical protein KJ950_06960 [Proteobacteria bacterium]|nr:hypothetical protein [Pseudomonadota bacterium]MBU1686986.1 hypothetical protein [Pseudomonadota bacterium]